MARLGGTARAPRIPLVIQVTVLFGLLASSSHGISWIVRPDGAGDYSSIQAAVDGASDGDSVLVAPGRYFETLWIEGKRVHLLSTDGPGATILDGGLGAWRPDAPVIHCFYQSQPGSLIEGFTIQNGSNGIQCTSASPVIRGNIIQRNRGPLGAGISAIFESTPHIEGNLIRSNVTRYECCFPSRGGGIYADESSPALIRRNVVAGNACRGLCVGGGISVYIATVEENTIVGNRCDGPGGGIEVAGEGAILYANIVVNNRASEFGDGIMVVRSATLTCNDVWNNGEEDYWGTAPGDGDFSADPSFCDLLSLDASADAPPTMAQFDLRPESPCLPDQHPGGGPCEIVGARPMGCGGDRSPSAPTTGAGDVPAPPASGPLLGLHAAPNPTAGGVFLEVPTDSRKPQTGDSIEILAPSGGIVAQARRIDPFTFYWDGTTDQGLPVTSGVYYARLSPRAPSSPAARVALVVIR